MVGLCPLCQQHRGDIGTPCSQTPACRDGGYHHVAVEDVEAKNRSAVPDPWIGRKVEPWLLVRRLGGGGFGTVYLALHGLDLATRGALKLIQAPKDDTAKWQQTLIDVEREVQALLDISHPNVVRISVRGPTFMPWGP